MSTGWIGVDLDGTLAGWGEEHPTDVLQVGPPIPRMVAQVKDWLAKGHEVRIFTARVGPASAEECAAAMGGACPPQAFIDYQRRLVQDWCLEHLGVVLPVTATKDFHMWALYDDRAQQVVPNQGVLVVDLLASLEG